MTGAERRAVLDAAELLRRLFEKAQGRRERAALRIAKELEEVAK